MQRKYRLYSSASLQENAQIMLEKAQQHYLINVLRFKPSHHKHALCLFNENDGEWQAELIESGKQYQLRLLKMVQPPPPKQNVPMLCFAPIRKGRLETLLEKATELGVAVLQPIRTEWTQFSLGDEARIQRILCETAEQCERLSIPKILPEITLQDLLASVSEDKPLLFFAEQGKTTPAPEWLQKSDDAMRDAQLLIGPEGGFSPDEMVKLHASHYIHALSLGTRILRSETAAMVALSLWQARFGDFANQR